MKRPIPGDVLAQHYRLTRVLKEGGTSMVFAAENVFTGKLVAIKWILPELMREREVSLRLLREAQLNAAIGHPNVVNVFDVGRHEGSLFLVMELLHGRPLSEALTDAPLDASTFIRLMMPVLRGVQAAHGAGVVHRDLKPENIFLCVDAHGVARETKVLDFGVSKLTRGSLSADQEAALEGTVRGTRQFMAPEQIRDDRNCDERSDIYALGVIFYRALSGVLPYDGATPVELAVRLARGNATPLSQRVAKLPRGLSDVVMRALAADPGRRFANVASLASALEPYTQGPEDSLRALLSLSDHPRRRPGQPGGLAIRHASADAPSRPGVLAATGRREGLRGSALAPPPPPPKLRQLSSPARVGSHGSALARRPAESAEPMAQGRRSVVPPKLKLVLPPLPPPVPELQAAAREERARTLGFVRWAVVPALGFVIALGLGWLAMQAFGVDWQVGVTGR